MVVTEIFSANVDSRRLIPLFSTKVCCGSGFPSPANDYAHDQLDLNEHLIQNSAATFYVYAEGNSMLSAGISPDDLLVVDKSLTPKNNDVVIVAIDGEYTVKRFTDDGETKRLFFENGPRREVTIHEDSDVIIWGVVAHVIHSFRSRNGHRPN